MQYLKIEDGWSWESSDPANVLIDDVWPGASKAVASGVDQTEPIDWSFDQPVQITAKIGSGTDLKDD